MHLVAMMVRIKRQLYTYCFLYFSCFCQSIVLETHNIYNYYIFIYQLIFLMFSIFLFLYSFIHRCIYCLGHFSPSPPLPHFSSQPLASRIGRYLSLSIVLRLTCLSIVRILQGNQMYNLVTSCIQSAERF
jgi:hypothetical protein